MSVTGQNVPMYKMSPCKKCPWGHNVPRQNVPFTDCPHDKLSPRQNVPKTKRPRTKCPQGQNVPKTKRPQDKMSTRQNVHKTKCPQDKMSPRQNVPKTKCPQDKMSPRQNIPKTKWPLTKCLRLPILPNGDVLSWDILFGQNVPACPYSQAGTFCPDKTSPLAYIAKRRRFVWTKRPRTKCPRTMSLDKIVGIGLVIREKEKVQQTRLLLFFHLKTDYSTLASLLELLRSHIGLLFFASGKAFYVVGVFWVLQVLD